MGTGHKALLADGTLRFPFNPGPARGKYPGIRHRRIKRVPCTRLEPGRSAESHDQDGSGLPSLQASRLMGDSLARRWRWLGTYYAWRTRGRDTVQTIEPWIKIAMGGAFLSGYRNLGTLPWWEALAIGGGILVAAEVAMVCLGAFDFRNGVIHRQTQLNNEQDPWKVRVLEILEKLEPRLL